MANCPVANPLQSLFEVKQGPAGQANNLHSIVDQVQAGDAHGVDQDDASIVVVAIGRRTTGHPGGGRLHDDDLVGADAGPQDAPLLDKRAGPYHRNDRTAAKADARAKAASRLRAGQDMRPADDGLEFPDERGLVLNWLLPNELVAGNGDVGKYSVHGD
ncbi:hypothetical protein [Reyranella sp.]|uniref:hypothetical protein n=1 Tax=Reyranella sp. TaxID=1929291 RepID=UPI003D149324